MCTQASSFLTLRRVAPKSRRQVKALMYRRRGMRNVVPAEGGAGGEQQRLVLLQEGTGLDALPPAARALVEAGAAELVTHKLVLGYEQALGSTHTGGVAVSSGLVPHAGSEFEDVFGVAFFAQCFFRSVFCAVFVRSVSQCFWRSVFCTAFFA